MSVELRWLASASASSCYAAERLLCAGTLVDPKLGAALAAPVAALAAAFDERGVEPRTVMAHVVPLSAGTFSPRELAKTSLRKALGPPELEWLVERVAESLAAIQSAFQEVLPGLVDELALRAEPLRGQWEARGPGLLAAARRWTEPAFLAERADVLLVHPAAGGGGRPYHLYNSVCIEAVLANPIVELPEVLRLGWLLLQLNAELPLYQGEMRRDRAFEVTALATLPVILAAAEDVELARPDEATLRRALHAWVLENGRLEIEQPDERAATLLRWWQTYAETRPAWPVALAALERML